MDTSATIAAWLSLGFSSLVLAGLITQAGTMAEHSDPFHEHRSAEYLGVWCHCRQPKCSSWVRRLPLEGPEIKAGLAQGFCGHNLLYLSRVPLCRPPGKAGWAAILAIFHANEVGPVRGEVLSTDQTQGVHGLNDLAIEWTSLKGAPLVRHQHHACVPIARSTLITLLAFTNARPVFSYSDASGFRAAYASYNGQWYISWPIAQEAMVRFAPHDSHAACTDVYPPCFVQRVDRCAQMVAGVVVGVRESRIQVAFCGRQKTGRYRLEYVVKSYAGSHGSRHLFNMLGGKVHEVDYMFARRVPQEQELNNGDLQLTLPSKNMDGTVMLDIPRKEQQVVSHALDALPWNHMAWSIHRGLRDILLAFARPTMDKYRSQLADLVKMIVSDTPHLLDARGWDPHFVRESMADMAASAILAGEGNSGDLVRVVTDVVRVIVEDWTPEQLDEVVFWRRSEREGALDENGIVALTKVFVLEWSNEFDYQMYHQLPTTVLFG